MTYDDWFTAPLECSHCGGEHTFRFCQALNDARAEAAEQKADEARDDRYFTQHGWRER